MQTFRTHLEEMHNISSDQPASCKRCNLMFQNSRRLLLHYQTRHDESSSSDVRTTKFRRKCKNKKFRLRPANLVTRCRRSSGRESLLRRRFLSSRRRASPTSCSKWFRTKSTPNNSPQRFRRPMCPRLSRCILLAKSAKRRL